MFSNKPIYRHLYFRNSKYFHLSFKSLITRNYASASEDFDSQINFDVSLSDPYIFPRKWPTRTIDWKNLIKKTYSWIQVFRAQGECPYKDEEHNIGQFKKKKAFELYKEMNGHFAQGNLEAIKSLVTSPMYNNLKFALKSKRHNTKTYYTIEELKPPKKYEFVQISQFEQFSSAQVMLKFHTKEKLVMFSKYGKQVGNMNSCEFIRYVVFRRDFTKKTGWKIAGYYNPGFTSSPPDLLDQLIQKMKYNIWFTSFTSLSPIIILGGAILV
ncbi:hypothetical protein Glove_508g63 [Diversispora epigaea]|uniref:Tim44-like domain-containing protein n=1 Tax=Diversispora epigaea TaxID=1348612 RepID=A0A397GJZ7_9GLOM|nr:hypothetical protein Glove_508g63 [Diversispora epigaea]